MKPTQIDYCQFLLSSQTNFTLTNHAEHHTYFSHDAINRYLRGEKLTSRLIWESVRSQIVVSTQGFLIFDDSVLDKNFSHKIELGALKSEVQHRGAAIEQTGEQGG